jgi:3-hydroxyacyl-CoA dehydrogenase
MPNPSFYNEPAFAPFPVSAQRVAGGLYGQKTGAGWYLGLPLSAPEGR